MIEICQSKIRNRSKVRCLTARGSSSWSYWCRADWLDLETTTEAVRSKYDFLQQGGVLDSFGNKFVANQQFVGRLFPKVRINNVPIPPPPDYTVVRGGDYVGPSSGERTNYLLTSRMPNIIAHSGLGWNVMMTAPVEHLVPDSACIVAFCFFVRYEAGAMGYKRTTFSVQTSCTPSDKLTAPMQPYAQLIQDLLSPDFPPSSTVKPDVLSIIRRRADTIIGILRGAAERAACVEEELGGFGYTTTTNYKNLTFGSLQDSDLDDVLNLAYDSVHHLHTWSEADLSTLGRKVIENINDFDSNALAYVSDLKEIGGSIRSVLALVGDYDNPKAWASAWLSLRFSDRLTIADTRELLESLAAALDRIFYTKARSHIEWTQSTSSFSYRHTRYQTIIVRNSHDISLKHSVDALMRWDVWPSLENAWDMIPLSFVVDWFLPISDILGQIDASVESYYLEPMSQYYSDRVEVDFVPSTLWSGDLRYAYFVRDERSSLSDVRPFEADISFIPSFGVVNIGDSLALAAQFLPA